MNHVISVKDTVTSLIESIDIFNYILKNHHRRVSIIAFNLGRTMDLQRHELRDLVLASSLHDIGALNVTDRNMLTQMDVKFPDEHEIIGSMMLMGYKPFRNIAKIIRHHHIHWEDVGKKYLHEDIPRVCHVLHLADRIDILLDPDINILKQTPTITRIINQYSGTLFSPEIVRKFNDLSVRETFWYDIEFESLSTLLSYLIEDEYDMSKEFDMLEELAATFSHIVDFRTQFTTTHSVGVGAVAEKIGMLYGFNPFHCKKLKIAGYLHDIGKVAVPTELLEKKGSLTNDEYNEVKMHTYYTYAILSKIKGFEDICSWASKHHERHDSTGYPFHISNKDFSIEIDIIAFADIFTSLLEDRPYRKGVSKKEALSILESMVPQKLSPKILNVVVENFDELNRTRIKIQDEHNFEFISKPVQE